MLEVAHSVYQKYIGESTVEFVINTLRTGDADLRF